MAIKKYESEHFGEVLEPETFQDLIELTTTRVPPLDGDVLHFWRGQARIDWKLDSGAVRRAEATDTMVFQFNTGQKVRLYEMEEETVANYESQLLSQAKKQGYQYLEGRRLSNLEVFARLQHYGAATRLLDFTKNMLVGLWFAVEDARHQDEYGALFGLNNGYVYEVRSHPDKYNSYAPAPDDTLHDIIMGCPRNKPDETTLIWDPPAIEGRMAAQHACFAFSKVCFNKWGSLACHPDDDALTVVAISPVLKKQAKEIFTRQLDFSTLTLFPDIEGFAQFHSAGRSIREMTRW